MRERDEEGGGILLGREGTEGRDAWSPGPRPGEGRDRATYSSAKRHHQAPGPPQDVGFAMIPPVSSWAHDQGPCPDRPPPGSTGTITDAALNECRRVTDL